MAHGQGVSGLGRGFGWMRGRSGSRSRHVRLGMGFWVGERPRG
jgi:hypothetical protein